MKRMHQAIRSRIPSGIAPMTMPTTQATSHMIARRMPMK